MIGSYHELYFDDVADGVAYCQCIVPHVVPPFGSLGEGQPSTMAVWLHVPRNGSDLHRGCYLYMSEAVYEALERAGQSPATTGTISRTALPETAVLVFGQDHLAPRIRIRERPPAKGVPLSSRVAGFERVFSEADAVLR